MPCRSWLRGPCFAIRWGRRLANGRGEATREGADRRLPRGVHRAGSSGWIGTPFCTSSCGGGQCTLPPDISQACQKVCQPNSTRHEQGQASAEGRPAGALPPKRSLGRDADPSQHSAEPNALWMTCWESTPSRCNAHRPKKTCHGQWVLLDCRSPLWYTNRRARMANRVVHSSTWQTPWPCDHPKPCLAGHAPKVHVRVREDPQLVRTTPSLVRGR